MLCIHKDAESLKDLGGGGGTSLVLASWLWNQRSLLARTSKEIIILSLFSITSMLSLLAGFSKLSFSDGL
jgi:hypothetical protein